MKIQYFKDTDTLYFQLNQAEIVESRDLDEDTLLELGKDGRVIAITIEHARERVDLSDVSITQIPAVA